MTPAERWVAELAAWAVPSPILESAPARPYVFSPEMFAAPPAGSAPMSRATSIAAAVLVEGGSVLDIGCGGGAAAFALVPPATRVIGIDRQQDMVDLFHRTALDRGLEVEAVAGSWPYSADEVSDADVVVSNNVLYNVGDLVAFASAATEHARRRVVFEITPRHPQTSRARLWKHFWDLDRPEGPTAELAADVLRDSGIPVNLEHAEATARDRERALPVEAAFWCRQLCLPADREPEVSELVAEMPFPAERAVIWWDV